MQVLHPDMDIKPYFLRQVQIFAKRRQHTNDIFTPAAKHSEILVPHEQVLLKNTVQLICFLFTVNSTLIRCLWMNRNIQLVHQSPSIIAK